MSPSPNFQIREMPPSATAARFAPSLADRPPFRDPRRTWAVDAPVAAVAEALVVEGPGRGGRGGPGLVDTVWVGRH